MARQLYLIKDNKGQYWNEEDYSYLVETSKENARPVLDYIVDSWIAKNPDIQKEKYDANIKRNV